MNDEGLAVELILVALLILFNGFFAGAELALVSARRSRLQSLARDGDRRAVAALKLLDDPDRFLATVQIGVTLVGTLASAVGGVAAVEKLEPMVAELPYAWARAVAEPVAVSLVVFCIAYASLVVGELAPKQLAVRHAETFALLVARPIAWLAGFSGPVVGLLNASSGLFLRLFGQRAQRANAFHTLDDLRALVREAEEQGIAEKGLLAGAIEFHDRDVREILTPVNRMRFVRLGAPIEDALVVARQTGHTRFPVIEGTVDDVVGLVRARDLYEAARSGRRALDRTLVQPVALVPWTKMATSLLAEMKRSHCQMAVAVDEHGMVKGLVTLEDLVEVIIGEIRDEHEVPEEPVKRLADGSLEAEGSVRLADLNERWGFALPESNDYVTLAGLVLHELGRMGAAGDEVTVGGVRLRVVAVEGRRITRVVLHPPVAAAVT
ncbi:MAG: hemolysin family protein [Vicinamibacteria bacterium]|nr:hemolysin family protein [Vicinamibacteria bacterium]